MDTQRNNADTAPDRLNEDWRFGRPHVHAQELLKMLGERPGDEGDLRLELSGGIGDITLGESGLQPADFASIGSGYLVRKALEKTSDSVSLHIVSDSDAESPLTLSCVARGLFLPRIDIVIEPGVHAHIVEKHQHSEGSAMICLRRYTVKHGADLTLELREEGCGDSTKTLNITHLRCLGNCRVRQFTSHSNHGWAREETTATLSRQDGESPDLLLLSANHLQGNQWLDQRTQQLHLDPGAKSRLLYKNVLDGNATAIFGGNIRVEPGGHDTDAYLSNLNLMLNEHATMHSLPGLEILADRVRCSHGSATAPMNPEQLFYLLSRGIDEKAARLMLADGFLADVRSQFRA